LHALRAPALGVIEGQGALRIAPGGDEAVGRDGGEAAGRRVAGAAAVTVALGVIPHHVLARIAGHERLPVRRESEVAGGRARKAELAELLLGGDLPHDEWAVGDAGLGGD